MKENNYLDDIVLDKYNEREPGKFKNWFVGTSLFSISFIALMLLLRPAGHPLLAEIGKEGVWATAKNDASEGGMVAKTAAEEGQKALAEAGKLGGEGKNLVAELDGLNGDMAEELRRAMKLVDDLSLKADEAARNATLAAQEAERLAKMEGKVTPEEAAAAKKRAEEAAANAKNWSDKLKDAMKALQVKIADARQYLSGLFIVKNEAKGEGEDALKSAEELAQFVANAKETTANAAKIADELNKTGNKNLAKNIRTSIKDVDGAADDALKYIDKSKEQAMNLVKLADTKGISNEDLQAAQDANRLAADEAAKKKTQVSSALDKLKGNLNNARTYLSGLFGAKEGGVKANEAVNSAMMANANANEVIKEAKLVAKDADAAGDNRLASELNADAENLGLAVNDSLKTAELAKKAGATSTKASGGTDIDAANKAAKEANSAADKALENTQKVTTLTDALKDKIVSARGYLAGLFGGAKDGAKDSGIKASDAAMAVNAANKDALNATKEASLVANSANKFGNTEMAKGLEKDIQTLKMAMNAANKTAEEATLASQKAIKVANAASNAKSEKAKNDYLASSAKFAKEANQAAINANEEAQNVAGLTADLREKTAQAKSELAGLFGTSKERLENSSENANAAYANLNGAVSDARASVEEAKNIIAYTKQAKLNEFTKDIVSSMSALNSQLLQASKAGSGAKMASEKATLMASELDTKKPNLESINKVVTSTNAAATKANDMAKSINAKNEELKIALENAKLALANSAVRIPADSAVGARYANGTTPSKNNLTATIPAGAYIQFAGLLRYNPDHQIFKDIKALGFDYFAYNAKVHGRVFTKVLVGPYETNSHRLQVDMNKIRAKIAEDAFVYRVK